MSDVKRLYRSKKSRMIAGVCGGLGEFFNIDPTIIRLIFVLGTFFGLGSLLVVYIVLMFVVPEEPGFNPMTPSSVIPPTTSPDVTPVEPADVDSGENTPSI